ncbi:MAG: hypothetical protein ACTSUV_03535 [Candidatus Ranarchaeia archaeon]
MATENRLLILKTEAGSKELIKIDPSVVNSKNTLIVLDEQNRYVWLWAGSNVTMIGKRTARRLANGLKSSGYQYGNTNVNPQATKLIEIYENDMEEEDKSNRTELMKIISRVKPLPGDPYLGFFDDRIKADVQETGREGAGLVTKQAAFAPPIQVEAKQPEPVALTAPEPETQLNLENQVKELEDVIIKTVQESKNTPSFTKVEQITMEKLSGSISEEAKAGVLLYSLLKEFKELFIAVQDENIRIEGPVEALCSFKLENGDLIVSPKLDFGGKKDSVLLIYKKIIENMFK